MRERREHQLTVSLAGNPNVGKSTLFNALTGLRQHTGNWPGKTVEVARGCAVSGDTTYLFTDLPGTYSLQGVSQEEQIAAEHIRHGEADCTVVVCDGSCLERSLILALQILQCTDRVVVCVNLMDEARRRGIGIDRAALQEALGAPVVMTAAAGKAGLEQLLLQVKQTALRPEALRLPSWEDPVTAAEAIALHCVQRQDTNAEKYRRQVERLFVSRRFGVPLLWLLFFGILWLTVWGANYPSMLLEGLFLRGYRLLSGLLRNAPWWLRGVLADGLYTTAANVIAVMLPPMAIFFPLFTILEDIGYLPRAAFLLDPVMARCGGCGKQALTICMGLGCNAVGVMGCRIIDCPKKRLAAILTNAVIPCNGRFPALILLGSLFFRGYGGLVTAACVAVGVSAAVAMTGLLTGTVLRDRDSTFVMELPPFRRPRLGRILLRSLLDRTLVVAGRALSVAAPAGVLLWVLANTPLLEHIVKFLEPAGRFLGMNGVLLFGFCMSLPANELLIPVVMMVLTQSGSLQATGNQQLLQSAMTWQMALCAMVFTLFHWPCATTLLTIRRETGSWKHTAAAFLLPTAVGCLLCSLLGFLLGSR